ncbi:hypothetical protein GC163_21615 [bacterium]|nr:hypothetical protein [bacterium]
MNAGLTDLLIGLNSLGNAAGAVLLAPIAWLPEWLSSTVIAMISGFCMLLCFRYTTRPESIRQTRRHLQANLFAVSLFRDNMLVCLREQTAMLGQGLRLLWLSLLPIAVMTVPMLLLLSQLAAWYQWRPLLVGESIVLTVFLNDANSAGTPVSLHSEDGVAVTTGPVVAIPAGYVCWDLRAEQPGHHPLRISAGDQVFEHELVVGNQLARLVSQRPSRSPLAILEHPVLPPPMVTSAVKSIELAYPERSASRYGLPAWLFHWLWVSSLSAVLFVPVLGVKF